MQSNREYQRFPRLSLETRYRGMLPIDSLAPHPFVSGGTREREGGGKSIFRTRIFITTRKKQYLQTRAICFLEESVVCKLPAADTPPPHLWRVPPETEGWGSPVTDDFVALGSIQHPSRNADFTFCQLCSDRVQQSQRPEPSSRPFLLFPHKLLPFLLPRPRQPLHFEWNTRATFVYGFLPPFRDFLSIGASESVSSLPSFPLSSLSFRLLSVHFSLLFLLSPLPIEFFCKQTRILCQELSDVGLSEWRKVVRATAPHVRLNRPIADISGVTADSGVWE